MQGLQSFNFFGKRSTPAPEVPVETQPVPAPEPQSQTPPTAAKTKPYGWILSPTIDLMFSCGGVLWLLYACYLLGAKPALEAGVAAATMWWVCKFGLIFFSYGHQPATLWRVYLSERTRRTLGPIVTAWGVVAIAMLGAAMYYGANFVTVWVKLIVWWQIQHVLAQSYGVALIYCYKRGYFMNNVEKSSFFWMINSSIIYFIIRACTFKACGQKEIYGMIIPFWGPIPQWVYYVALSAVIGTTVWFCYNVFAKFRRDKQFFPWPGLLAVFTGLATYHMDFAFFGAAFTLFTIAYYHGCQYMVVTTSYYLKERGLPEGLPAAKIGSLLKSKAALRYFVVLCIGGILLSDVLPKYLATFGVQAAVTYLAVFAMANFHHYFADALIWKLRDPEVRKLLVA